MSYSPESLTVGDVVEVELDDSRGRTRTATIIAIREVEWMPGRFSTKLDVDINGNQFEVSPSRVHFDEEI